MITKEAIEAAKSAYWHEVHNGGGYSDKCYEVALTAALPFLPIAGEGKVKALGWEDATDRGYSQANCALGQYQVIWLGEFECWQCGRPHRDGLDWKDNFSRHPSKDDAKAAAQADFERRILSALVSSPGKDGGQEVEAAQITMGRGLVDVSRIEHEGRAGILFRPRDDHIPVGEEGELQPGEYWPVKGDVVIWIENEGGARVIETYLSAFLPYQPDSTALVERLTKALEPFAKEAGCYDPDTGDGDDTVWATPVYFKIRDLREARNALSSSQSTSRENEQ